MKSLVLSIALLFIGDCLADEPHWTPSERLTYRECVLQGEVVSVKRVRKLNKHEDLMLAIIQIQEVLKDHDAIKSKRIKVFYKLNPKGAGWRCPRYADPKEGDRATFYLGYHQHLTEEPNFIIEMGSDIHKKK